MLFFPERTRPENFFEVFHHCDGGEHFFSLVVGQQVEVQITVALSSELHGGGGTKLRAVKNDLRGSNNRPLRVRVSRWESARCASLAQELIDDVVQRFDSRHPH